ncbi:hypothetical protein SAMN06272771_2926 [Streptomyces sp. Ag82_O1-12]|uniref:hypothetical protein n=1 Tax=unclassified Streptomyces TaxID=2593676 RepID=UPI000BCB8B2C|nr:MULTISPECIES: hypothetical protein [unclassified Streptomyces]SMQ16556.1 hypothetical protein SAMN06272771_2926 [Streptomyces sp. Ag82_O1-12]SOD45584.1 hypothetical protein SAMN06272727_2922 [Streptomyces sp. Ag82_G6-1]
MGSLRVTVCTGVLAAVALAPAAYAADAADAGSVSATPAAPAPGSDITLRVTGCAQRTAVAASTAFVADARLTVTGAGELTGESRVRSTAEAGSYAVRVTCGATRQTGTLTVRDGTARGPESGQPSAHEAVPLPVHEAAPLPVPGAGGQPPAQGTDGHLPAPGAAPQPQSGRLPAPGAAGESGRLPAPDGGGQLSAPDGGGQPSAPGVDGEPSAPGADDDASLSHRPGAPASPVAPVQAGGGGAAELVAAEERGAGPGTAQGVTGLLLAGVAAVVVASRGLRRGRGTD